MTIITTGAHGRTPQDQIPPGVQAAHCFVADDPEGRERQASLFMAYAKALGLEPPYVLTGPDDRSDLTKVSMSDWAAIVSSATNKPVEIR